MSKKQTLIILGILLIVFIAVSIYKNYKENAAAGSNNNLKLIIYEDQSLEGNEYYKLGMTRDNVYYVLKQLNYKIVHDEKAKGSPIWCDSIYFNFDKDDKVKGIFVNDILEYTTASGLKMGDVQEKIIEMYGKKYSMMPKLGEPGEEESMIYEYKFKDNYFQIQVSKDEHVIIGFGVSKVKINIEI